MTGTIPARRQPSVSTTNGQQFGSWTTIRAVAAFLASATVAISAPRAWPRHHPAFVYSRARSSGQGTVPSAIGVIIARLLAHPGWCTASPGRRPSWAHADEIGAARQDRGAGGILGVNPGRVFDEHGHRAPAQAGGFADQPAGQRGAVADRHQAGARGEPAGGRLVGLGDARLGGRGADPDAPRTAWRGGLS